MVRKVLVSAALAVALAMVYFSAVAECKEDEASRSVPLPHCHKAGLCPYVKRIIPEFIYHTPVYAQSPAVPHYPPLHHIFPLPVVPHLGGLHPGGAHHGGAHPGGVHPAHPPSIVVHPNPHHGGPHAPAPGHGDVHHPPAHHVTRRDAPAHPPAHVPSHPQHVQASLCGNLCTHDNVCPGDKKCCPTECGYSCFDPVHIAE